MNVFQRKIALRVLGIHCAVVIWLLLFAGLKGCFRPKPRPEIITFIEFGQPAPPVEIQPMAQQPDPEPPAPEPEPAPVPEPIKKPLPKPDPRPAPKPEPAPAPKPEPAPKPKPAEPEKPKQKLVKPEDIKIGKRINEPKPAQPTVTSKEISNALKDLRRTDQPIGSSDANRAYDAHIYSVFYNAWAQPAVPAARPAEVALSITADGRIRNWRLSRSSGDASFDATVEQAVKSISVLPRKPPPGYPLDNIVVQFRIAE